MRFIVDIINGGRDLKGFLGQESLCRKSSGKSASAKSECRSEDEGSHKTHPKRDTPTIHTQIWRQNMTNSNDFASATREWRSLLPDGSCDRIDGVMCAWVSAQTHQGSGFSRGPPTPTSKINHPMALYHRFRTTEPTRTAIRQYSIITIYTLILYINFYNGG